MLYFFLVNRNLRLLVNGNSYLRFLAVLVCPSTEFSGLEWTSLQKEKKIAKNSHPVYLYGVFLSASPFRLHGKRRSYSSIRMRISLWLHWNMIAFFVFVSSIASFRKHSSKIFSSVNVEHTYIGDASSTVRQSIHVTLSNHHSLFPNLTNAFPIFRDRPPSPSSSSLPV